MDGDPRHAQPPRRHRPRRLGGQHRGRVPRGGRASSTSCSTSSSSAEPIASRSSSARTARRGSVERCLGALEPQVDGAEVIVCEPTRARRRCASASRAHASSSARARSCRELWRDGIDAATGAIVALTISPMVPAPDWVAAIRERLGAGRRGRRARSSPGEGLRVVDWAEYFCRYARDMRPFARAREPGRPPGRQLRLPARAAGAHARAVPRRLLGAGGQPPRCARSGVRLWHDAGRRGLPGPLGRVRRVRSASGSSTAAPTGASAARGSARARNVAGVRRRPRSCRSCWPRGPRARSSSRGRYRSARSSSRCPRSSPSTSPWAAGEAMGTGHIARPIARRAVSRLRRQAPQLSVVVASVNGMPYLGECLDALAARCARAPR